MRTYTILARPVGECGSWSAPTPMAALNGHGPSNLDVAQCSRVDALQAILQRLPPLHSPLCQATFANLWPHASANWTGTGCLVVVLPKEPGSLELTLVSHEAIVPTLWRGCSQIAGAWACTFNFECPEAASYNVALRGDICRVSSAEYRAETDGFAALGFGFGREWQVRMAHGVTLHIGGWVEIVDRAPKN